MNTLKTLEKKNLVTPYRAPATNSPRVSPSVSTSSGPATVGRAEASRTLDTLDDIQVGWSQYTQGNSTASRSQQHSAFEGASINATFLGKAPTRDRILPLGPPQIEPGEDREGRKKEKAVSGERNGESGRAAEERGRKGKSKGKGGRAGAPGDSSEYSGPVGDSGQAGSVGEPKTEEERQAEAIERLRRLLAQILGAGRGFGGG